MIVGLVILLAFQLIGTLLERIFSLPIPGPVLGMFLLLLALLCNDRLAQYVRPIALTLISYLSVFFVPAGVGIILHLERIRQEWLAIGMSLLLSTALAMAVTALTIKYTARWLAKKQTASENQA
jgi:putative effector of murein hydrolase LrgA (UPF0299 family)